MEVTQFILALTFYVFLHAAVTYLHLHVIIFGIDKYSNVSKFFNIGTQDKHISSVNLVIFTHISYVTFGKVEA